MSRLAATAVIISLSGCVTPIETHGIDAALAGHCKMVAYQIDQTSQQTVHHGWLGFAISQSNENTRRQEIFDACIQAGGK